MQRQQRAEETLDALARTWAQLASTPQCGQAGSRDPVLLAREFRKCLQAQKALAGFRISSVWISEHYPSFTRAMNVLNPPPYKDFARELALEMRRRRKEYWHNGKRCTQTFYEFRPLAPKRTERRCITDAATVAP